MAETNKQRFDRSQKLIYWQAHIEQYTRSRLSVSQYCREQGLSLCQFKYWQERVTMAQTPLFLEVETTKYQAYTQETQSERKITVETPKGMNVTIQTNQFESDFMTLMRVMSTCSC